jgi:hypothetical protein
MLSKTDIKNLKTALATKKDLKDLEKNFIKRSLAVFATKEDLENLKSELITRKEHERVIEMLDAIYGEIKNIREEQLIHVELHRRIREEIDDIKTRIAAKS